MASPRFSQNPRQTTSKSFQSREKSGFDPDMDRFHSHHETSNNISNPSIILNRNSSESSTDSRFESPSLSTIVDPEEVYISDCCGVSKELQPTIKFMSTYRGLFLLFNFFVFAFGFADLGMGLWFRIDPKVYEIHKYIETQNFTIAGWIALFGGFLACLVSLLGICASRRQISCLLIVYLSVIVLLTISFVGSLVLLVVYGLGPSLERFMVKEIFEQIRRRAMLNNVEQNPFAANDASQFLDFIQVKLRCCGATDFLDYAKNGLVPPTTCYTIDKNFVSAPGCGRAIRELFDIRAGLAAGFLLGSIISQLTSIVIAALIYCAIYHWRATPRPATPMETESFHQLPRQYEHDQLESEHPPQRIKRSPTPRAMTPVVR